jgi:hypothetical protein
MISSERSSSSTTRICRRWVSRSLAEVDKSERFFATREPSRGSSTSATDGRRGWDTERTDAARAAIRRGRSSATEDGAPGRVFDPQRAPEREAPRRSANRRGCDLADAPARGSLAPVTVSVGARGRRSAPGGARVRRPRSRPRARRSGVRRGGAGVRDRSGGGLTPGGRNGPYACGEPGARAQAGRSARSGTGHPAANQGETR